MLHVRYDKVVLHYTKINAQFATINVNNCMHAFFHGPFMNMLIVNLLHLSTFHKNVPVGYQEIYSHLFHLKNLIWIT